jgi:hypothetical protein
MDARIFHLPRSNKPVERVTVSMPSDLVEHAKKVALESDTSVSKVISHAVKLEKHLQGHMDQGAKLVLIFPDQSAQEIRFENL